jgi:hypothetical protein
MKSYSSFLICGAFSALVLALAGTKVDVARADCTNPGITDWVSWDGSYDSWIHSTGSGSNYNFTTTQGFHWCYTNTPTNGAFEWVEHANDNVSSVTYSPAYFFPSSNQFTLEVQISGHHDTPTSYAYVDTLGWCWSPYKTANRTTNIYAH